MSFFRNGWRALPTVVVLACAAPAFSAPALTTIQDVLYRADGSRFNGTVKFTWNSFHSGDNNPIPSQGITVNVVNGNLKVRLVPTTNASAGASYSVTYMSQGKYQFSETWAVPPSSTTLRVRDVRVAIGSTVGPPTISTEILISDVTGLSAELAARPQKGSSFAPSRAAVINASGQIDAATGNLGDCLHVDGSSSPCGTGGGSSNVIFADSETPAGLVNGVNTAFTLNNAPSPAGSLMLYRNGVLLKQNIDYSVAGNALSFYSSSAPQAGDFLTANYRYVSGVAAAVQSYSDGETPTGQVNGSNGVFTLGAAPSPQLSLQFFRNGLLMKQGADYTLSGNTVTFYSAATPQAGDLLTAYYRY